ncbi:MAG TPA: cytochrome P450 [Nevskiaceae bacterium]|nr:cytochrome P450 [Nevskiaceae bacterium]
MREFDTPMSAEELDAFAQSFDHHSPTYAKNPYEIYRHMRERCPVAHSPNHGGFWIPSRREDIAAVAHDDVTFTSTEGPSIPKFPQKLHPVDMDPPESLEWRAMMNPLMAPAGVLKLEAFIRDTSRRLADAFIESGSADLVTQLARPLTTLTTIKFAGLDDHNADFISDTIHRGIVGEIDPMEYMANIARMEADIDRQIEEQRVRPKEDGAISHLIHKCRFRGESLSTEDIRGTVNLFLGGGVDTTQATLSVAYLYLSRHTDLRARLAADSELRHKAMEEFFRFASPQQTLARTATKDCTLGGQAIKAGDQVLLPWAAGNWDPEEFPEPDRFIPDRFPNRHMTFGVGAHRCFGSNLARKMFMVALEEVLTRMPDYRVNEEGLVRARSCGIVYCFTHVPVTFTPGKRA